MSEIQALILTFVGCVVAVFATLLALKQLGADLELMALAGMLWVCVAGWESAGVVMRYAEKRRREEKRRR